MTLVIGVVVVLGLVSLRWIGAPPASVPGSPGQDEVESLLMTVEIIAERPAVPGYERDCGSGSGCVFGTAWTDMHDGPGGRNGCSSREDVLRRDLRDIVLDGQCGVAGGTLLDPYTGREINTHEVGTSEIHVDHVIPLAAAWDLGAADWTVEERTRFANDLDVNLLAVSGRINMQKGDLTPGEWMPPATEWRCFYAARYLTAAVTYSLPVTEADSRALERAARRCPRVRRSARAGRVGANRLGGGSHRPSVHPIRAGHARRTSACHRDVTRTVGPAVVPNPGEYRWPDPRSGYHASNQVDSCRGPPGAQRGCDRTVR